MTGGASALAEKRRDRTYFPVGEPAETRPTDERWEKGDVRLPDQQVPDSDGRPGAPFRIVSIVASMERDETITREMADAGERFHAEFVVAQLHAIKAADMGRVPAEGMRADNASHRIQRARDSIWEALQVLGGIQSPCGSIAWHVLGCERTVKEWALTRGWASQSVAERQQPIKPIRQETASGILIGTLGALAAHYFGVADNRN